MKDWFGILIFVGNAIANIVMEQNRQKKKKAATPPRPASPPASPPAARTAARPPHRTPAPVNIPSNEEPSLQEVLQTLLQIPESGTQRRSVSPARNPELENPVDSSDQMQHQGLVRAAPVPPSLPPSLPPTTAATASATAAPTAPMPQGTPAATLNGQYKLDFRSRTALRRAIIMSELLGKPKGLQ